ncbi:MAG TPA: cobalt transporter CbiM [Deltaproteobacteria bacterium]|nr:cobalt transporter CbiM [Deltaproteobacteria bacterium]
MHIPDGYLGPQTCAAYFAVMAPLWYGASRMVRRAVPAGRMPFLALAAAFSFVVMMFNIPVPGGSTGHAVGGAVAALALGPWAAMAALTIVVVVQALLFGDGGVTAIGANCFNMAFVMPFTAWYVFRFIAGGAAASSARTVFAAALAGYISINAAALTTALAFGIQPLVATAPDGTPLYAPYGLEVAVAAMAFEHLFFFGFVEAVVTGLVAARLAAAGTPLLAAPGGEERGGRGAEAGNLRGLYAGILFLVFLTPLGLAASGAAWGEWSAGELSAMIGYTPEGLAALEGLWSAPAQGYLAGGWGSAAGAAAGYVVSALAGVAVVTLAARLVARLLPSGG